jgi:RNA polymerase sigma factor (sigma-70 family)
VQAERRMEKDPDGDLVRRIGAGDETAMQSLIVRKLPRLLAVSARMLGDRMEAEDVAQETFMRVWRHAGRWRFDIARFDTWMHRVALNLCYDRLRRRKDWQSDDIGTIADGADASLVLEHEEPGARVERALQGIAARQREAIILTYYQELSNVEAANAMGVSVEALESLLSRGRRALRSVLLKDEEHE